MVVIEPRSGGLAVLLREVWSYRELLGFLVWRDIKVRYKQTLLGGTWALLQPLLTMLIATIFFGKLGGMAARTGGVPYPLFAFAGLLPWTFFSNALTNGGNSLIANPNLMTKVFFPRILMPAGTVLAGLVDLVISFVMLAILMAYYRVAPGIGILMLPVLLFFIVLLAVSVGSTVAATTVRYRDMRYVLPLLVQSWMLVSPVIWPPSIIPANLRPLMWLNPMSGLLNGFRAALLNQPLAWNEIAACCALTLVIVGVSARWFRKVESSFADLI